jgi:CheY-like chemotaxis protein
VATGSDQRVDAVVVDHTAPVPVVPAGTAVVALAQHATITDRLAAAGHGADVVRDAISLPSEIVAAVAQAIATRRAAAATRVLLAADPKHRAALERVGLTVEMVDPDGDWIVEPGPLVLESLELCAALRTDARWAAVPIVMVGVDAAAAFAAGADDAAPAKEVGIRMRGRIARGAVHRHDEQVSLSRLIRMAERMNRPLCVARVIASGDRSELLRKLRGALRGEDVVVNWGDSELLVGMFGAERRAGIDRMAGLLAGTGARGAVAEYPTDGADLEALHRQLSETLPNASRDETLGVGTAHLGTQLVDVAIVEDEDAAADLMMHSLTSRGHRCWRFSNGAGAVEMLGGQTPKVRARVILLDLNMPAVGGLEVLALLSQDGTLEHTRVIVVSASNDSTLMARARSAGASEYFVKPLDFIGLARSVDGALGRA